MVERVAAAIMNAAGQINASQIQDDVTKRHATSLMYAKRYAAAAIAAMREPTEEMARCGGIGREDAQGVWRRMIDAALKE